MDIQQESVEGLHPKESLEYPQEESLEYLQQESLETSEFTYEEEAPGRICSGSRGSQSLEIESLKKYPEQSLKDLQEESLENLQGV